MPVKQITGNLLDFPEGITVLAHCANCQNTFGSGIARSLKEEYPQSYEADCEAAKQGKNKLGTMSVANLLNGKKIVNVYAQDFFGTDKRQVDYEAFYQAFETLRGGLEMALERGRKHILGVPYKIASDRAGGSWRVIETMLKDIFENSPVELIIVKLPEKNEKTKN